MCITVAISVPRVGMDNHGSSCILCCIFWMGWIACLVAQLYLIFLIRGLATLGSSVPFLPLPRRGSENISFSRIFLTWELSTDTCHFAGRFLNCLSYGKPGIDRVCLRKWLCSNQSVCVHISSCVGYLMTSLQANSGFICLAQLCTRLCPSTPCFYSYLDILIFSWHLSLLGSFLRWNLEFSTKILKQERERFGCLGLSDTKLWGGVITHFPDVSSEKPEKVPEPDWRKNT